MNVHTHTHIHIDMHQTWKMRQCLPYLVWHMISESRLYGKNGEKNKQKRQFDPHAFMRLSKLTIAQSFRYRIDEMPQHTFTIWSIQFPKKKHLMPTGKVALFIIGCKTCKSAQFIWSIHTKGAFSCSLTHRARFMYYLENARICIYWHKMLTLKHNTSQHSKTMTSKYSKTCSHRNSMCWCAWYRKWWWYHSLSNEAKGDYVGMLSLVNRVSRTHVLTHLWTDSQKITNGNNKTS